MTRLADTIDSASRWVTLAGHLRDEAETTEDPEERQLALEVAALCVDFGMRRILDAQALTQEYRTEQPADCATGCQTTEATAP